MTHYSGETGSDLAAARTALAVRDRALGGADLALTGVIDAAYRIAAESIQRIDAARSQIDSLGCEEGIDEGVRSRLILERHREIIGVINDAKDAAAVKTSELQRIRAEYPD